MSEMRVPEFREVLAAATRIRPYVDRTPLRNNPALERLTGRQLWFKHENLQVTGAFKVRGGINLISTLGDSATGVIAASTGNHGQSVAFAANRFGLPATIYVPEQANPIKVEAMRDLGAEVVHFGHDFTASAEEATRVATSRGLRFIHSGDEPLLIAGVGTIALEIFEDQPEIETLIVPIGGGSGAAAACVVRDAVAPNVRVIGVQSAAAPSAFESWRQKKDVEAEATTFAEGLSTRRPFALPQLILRERLDEFILVSDDELREAQRLLITTTKTMVEAAGAASLAAALKLKDELGPKTALVISGANVSPHQLSDLFADQSASISVGAKA
jgi:threonine dehydratase